MALPEKPTPFPLRQAGLPRSRKIQGTFHQVREILDSTSKSLSVTLLREFYFLWICLLGKDLSWIVNESLFVVSDKSGNNQKAKTKKNKRAKKKQTNKPEKIVLNKIFFSVENYTCTLSL